jgi:hypothetical protein
MANRGRHIAPDLVDALVRDLDLRRNSFLAGLGFYARMWPVAVAVSETALFPSRAGLNQEVFEDVAPLRGGQHGVTESAMDALRSAGAC